MSEFDHAEDVGAPDPELNTSPIAEENADLMLMEQEELIGGGADESEGAEPTTLAATGMSYAG